MTMTDEPILPDVHMHRVMPNAPVTGRVVETQRCTRAGAKAAGIVRHVSIDVSGTPLAGHFAAGQSFGVYPPGEDHNGKPHALRLYSIASPGFGEDGQGNVLATTVKRLIAEREPQTPQDDPGDHRLHLGVASNYLCDLRVGDEVQVTGPQGKRFLLPVDHEAHDYCFLATGTGIAPFRGMLMELLQGPVGPTSSQIHLIMGVPYRTDLLYDEQLRALAAQHPNFHYHEAISREIDPVWGRGVYTHQLIEHKLETFGPLLSSRRTLVYVCGLAGMQFGVYQQLVEHGLADGYLKINDDLIDTPPSEWTPDLIKRRIKPTRRLMLEVY